MLGLQPGERARAGPESKNVVAPSFGVTTTCAVIPARSEPARCSSSAACWESSPGTVIASVGPPADGDRGADGEPGGEQPQP